jgi:hypothetical protein
VALFSPFPLNFLNPFPPFCFTRGQQNSVWPFSRSGMVAVFVLVNLTFEMAIPRDCVDCSRSRGFFHNTSAIFGLKTKEVPWPGCSHRIRFAPLKCKQKTFQLKNVKIVCVCVWNLDVFRLSVASTAHLKVIQRTSRGCFPTILTCGDTNPLSLSSVGHVQKGMNDEWGF